MADSQILLREPKINTEWFPHETILRFEIVDGCVGSNEGMFSATKDTLLKTINDYSVNEHITCIGFECNDNVLDKALYFCKYLKLTTDFNTVWYNITGDILIDKAFKSLHWLDYIFIRDDEKRMQIINAGDAGFILKEII